MMDYRMERIQYLTRKAQMGAIMPYEQDELAQLLGQNQQEFNSGKGLALLVGLALAAIAAAIIAEILTGGRR
jgi:hypothetical protein